MTEIHTCSYACERPECIRAQRDELASRLAAETSNARGSCYEGVCPDCNNLDCDCDAPPPAAEQREAVRYDAGLLSDYGGGDVNWWWDYIRAELERAHDFYTSALSQQPEARGVVDGVALIETERRRQVEAEGWTPEHDDEHGDGAMAHAAACYAYGAPFVAGVTVWPWSADWWKPTDRIRDLTKAGALIAAEIDRLQRAALTEARNVQ